MVECRGLETTTGASCFEAINQHTSQSIQRIDRDGVRGRQGSTLVAIPNQAQAWF